MYWNVLISVAGSDGTPRKIIGPINDREGANQLGLRFGAISHFENNSGVVTVRSYVPRKPYDPSYNPIKTFAIQIDGSMDCDGKTIDIDEL